MTASLGAARITEARDEHIVDHPVEIGPINERAQDNAAPLPRAVETGHPVHAVQEQIAVSFASREKRSGARYLKLAAVLMAAGIAGLWNANVSFAPTLYDRATAEEIARAFDNGRNYAVFDLNLDIRNLRDAHIARMDETPDAVVLGASHWQEAHAEIVDDRSFYNAHVHRDYYEDMLAMTEMFVRHDRLPETMIITIRDKLFTPIAARTDFLWLPGIPYYRAMAERLGLRPHHPVETLPVVNWKDKLSLRHLRDNAVRWFNATERPHATDERQFEALDTLLPGGSILWSAEHQAIFTPERSEREALAFAEAQRNNPPQIDPKGVEALEALFVYLKEQGVTVYLAHPPFNPFYWDAVQDSPYREGLHEVEALTRDFAARHGFEVIGGFDPREVGCTTDLYIDAEHAAPSCLGNVYRQFMALDGARTATGTPAPAPAEPILHKAALEAPIRIVKHY